MFSTYKTHCTLKGLLGVALHGVVTFNFPLYAESIRDKHIMWESRILSLLRPRIAIMVDQGFLVGDFMLCKISEPGWSQSSACEISKPLPSSRCMWSTPYAEWTNTNSLTIRFHSDFFTILISHILKYVSWQTMKTSLFERLGQRNQSSTCITLTLSQQANAFIQSDILPPPPPWRKASGGCNENKMDKYVLFCSSCRILVYFLCIANKVTPVKSRNQNLALDLPKGRMGFPQCMCALTSFNICTVHIVLCSGV